ncbi:MAG: DUF2829 domain-containing protein [Eubacteriales bacterium]
MAKFRKKAVVIEAEQYFDNAEALCKISDMGLDPVRVDYSVVTPLLLIKTLEGEMAVGEGDWIIKGVAGEFYPCKADIFAKTYETADKMTFTEALEALKHGFAVRRDHWIGFWKMEKGTVMMYSKDGSAVDIRETNDVFYTLENIAANDWVHADNLDTQLPFVKTMRFGEAIRMMKLGKKVARQGWNGKKMWIVLMPSLYLPPYNAQEPGAKVNDRTAKHIGKDTPLDSQPYFVMWTAAGQWQPGWLASQSDMLAEDWVIVDGDQDNQNN